MDANGDWQWLGGSWANYADGEFRDSGSNSRTTVAVSDLIDVPSEIDLSGYNNVVLEVGTDTRIDPQGNERTSSFKRYFETGDGPFAQFLGEIVIGDDGYAQIRDSAGNVFNPSLDLKTDNYTLSLPPGGWGGWGLELNGTAGSDTLDFAAIAEEQDLSGKYNIAVDRIYARLDGQGGDDKIFGAGGMDSLRVHFGGSNFVDGRTNPSYLGSDGNFFSAHDRYVVNHDVVTSNDLDLGDYLLVSVRALVAQSAANAAVLLKDLGGSGALSISSIVDLIDGYVLGEDDTSQFLSVLDQISAKAVSLGIGEMRLDELDALMIKVQSETENSITVEVDFIKDIDMVSVVGQLPDGTSFTSVQSMINPVGYTLQGNDDFSNPFSNGVRGSFRGTNANDQVDLSGESVGYVVYAGNGDDNIIGTDFSDVLTLQGKGVYTIDGGQGYDTADINVTGMWNDDPGAFGLHVEFDEQTNAYTVFDSFADKMEEMLTVSPNGALGWTAISTDYAKEKFDIPDANLTNVESIRIFIGLDKNNNDDVVYRTLELTPQLESSTNIKTDNYSLKLPPASWGGWSLELNGTAGSDTLDFAEIAEEQDLSGKYNIAIDRIYTRLDGQGGDDKIFGAGGMDSLRVHFGGSNFVDGRTNPSYLGSDGDFFSAHDRYVVNHDVTTSDDLDLGDYLLVGVRALVAKAPNAAVLLQDLGASQDALSISSVVDLIDGYVLGEDDTSQFLSVLDQISAKAVSLGIGEMRLDELDALMIKVQSETENSITVEVDFIKDIDMVSVVGQLPDGTSFTSVQSMINPVGYTLQGNDDFSNPFSNGVRGSFRGTNANDQVDLSGESVGYVVYAGNGDDNIIGTDFSDVLTLQGKGVYTIDGGQGYDTADINVTGMWNDDPGAFGLHVEFDEQTNAYTVFDSFADKMEEMLTVSPNGALGWTAISTDYAKEKFDIPDANLTNVESIRIFIGLDKDNNDDAVYQIIELVGVPDAVPAS